MATRKLDLGNSPTAPNTGPTGDERIAILAALGLTPRIRRHASAGNAGYLGSAPGGSSEDASVWTITRITVATAGTVTTAEADNVKWTDYLTATYT